MAMWAGGGRVLLLAQWDTWRILLIAFLPIADDELEVEVEVEVEAVLEVVGWAVWSGMDAPFWEAAAATTSMT